MSTHASPSRRLFVSMIVSLDGYIEGPDRELDWFADGDPQFEQYCDEMIDSVGLALYGRRAYELMLQLLAGRRGATRARRRTSRSRAR